MDHYVERLLQLRARPEARRELRYGERVDTEFRAYRHLVPFWQEREFLRQPMLLHAALAATYPTIRQVDGVSFGRAAQRLSPTSVQTRLIAVQRVDLPSAHNTFRVLLGAAPRTGFGLDWNLLWRTYRNWDHPEQEPRLRARRGLLNDYFRLNSAAEQTKPPTDQTSTDDPQELTA